MKYFALGLVLVVALLAGCGGPVQYTPIKTPAVTVEKPATAHVDWVQINAPPDYEGICWGFFEIYPPGSPSYTYSGVWCEPKEDVSPELK